MRQIARFTLLHFSGLFLIVFIVAFLFIPVEPVGSPLEVDASLVVLFSGLACIGTFIFHFVGKLLKRG